jgi:hypothetical protein
VNFYTLKVLLRHFNLSCAIRSSEMQLAMADEAKESDAEGYVSELINLMKTAKDLKAIKM